MSDPMPAWERRFRAPVLTLPDFSPRAPERLVYRGTESGVWQVHAWDRANGMRRRVTDHPVGVTDGAPTLDGEGVVYWQDETGDESGRWFVQPFAGGEPRPFLEGAPPGWNDGIAQAPGVVAASISDREGFHVYVSEGGGPVRELRRSEESMLIGGWTAGSGRGGFSADGSLLCVEHSEHGDLIHPALRVIDPRSGETVGEQRDEGMALSAACWSPVLGDQRLAFVHERDGEERPGIWNLATGERTDLRLELDGVVTVLDWWPGGEALLLSRLREGRHRLFRHDLQTGEPSAIDHPDGQVSEARVRPDGSVWYRWASGAFPPMVLDDRGGRVIEPEGDVAPEGRPYVSWSFENEHGQRVHGFHVTPEGPGPFPVLMFVHGGPTWLHEDRWEPEVQSYVDAGFAVGMVNYRGSVGYGREWRDVLIGDVGGPELEDINAGLRDLAARGIADPSRAVVGGWSWGGYITLMELGKHPELWTCGVAGIPVGDYEASYEDMSPILQAYDRALLGGEPKDVPDLMRDRNPINFVDAVQAPVLFVIGENDSRCPFRQAMAYVEKLAARDHPHEVYLFSTGHGSNDVSEEVTQQRVILDFLARQVPGTGPAARPDRAGPV